MDWFKHKTASLDDPDFNAILDEFGSDGYMMFFGLLEIYGREFSNTNSDGFLSVRLAFVARKLRKSSVKVRKFLNFCGKLINKPRFVYSIDGAILSYKVPDFIDLASNWTKRQTKTPIEVPTEVPIAIRRRSRRRNKKENKEGPPNPPWNTPDNIDFDLFWNTYPKKVGKQKCLEIWVDLKKKKARPSINDIVKALKIQKVSEDWTKENGRYIPNPSTWLNQGRWDDELREIQPEHNSIKPITYAQAQDAERRMTAKWLLKEMKNDKQKGDNEGIDKNVSRLPYKQTDK